MQEEMRTQHHVEVVRNSAPPELSGQPPAAPRLRSEEELRKAGSLIHRSRFLGRPPLAEPKTGRSTESEEERERSAAFSYAHLTWILRDASAGGYTPTELECCSFGEASAVFLPQQRSAVSDAGHGKGTGVYWLSHLALSGERLGCAGAGFVSW